MGIGLLTIPPQWRGLRLLTPAASAPLGLEAVKAHLRLEVADDDALVSGLVSTACQYVEHYTRRAMIKQKWRMTLDAFPGCIDLPVPPVSAIDAITYLDDARASQTVAPTDYSLVADHSAACVVPIFGKCWPQAQPGLGAVTIDYWTGYTDKAGDPDGSVPAPLKQAALLLIGHWYENREAVGQSNQTSLPFAVEALLSPFRALRF